MNYKFTISILIFIIISMFASTGICQNSIYYEHKDDDYLPLPDNQLKSSNAYFFNDSSIFTIQVNVDSSGYNIINDAANEPSLAIDFSNPKKMVIGWRQFDNIQSNFRQAGLAYTKDAGQNWINTEPLEMGIFRSDPVLCSDNIGNFYYNSLSTDPDYSCDVFKTDSLEVWDDKTYAYGGDKQWMAIDNSNSSSNGNIYAFWKAGISSCEGSFTRSLDKGESYESCSEISHHITRGTLCVGPDGEVYACGGLNNSHMVIRSNSAMDSLSDVDWEEGVYVDLKGEQALYAGPNPSGMLGQVWVATDNSENASRGNVYLISSTKRNDNSDPSDVMFSKSTNGGITWAEAIVINDDNSTDNWQWFGTMSVAPNGRIDVVWLDTRDNPNTYLSSLYYSYSEDAGETWTVNKKLSESFDPHLGWPNQQKMGDYFHMVSFNDAAHLAWAATFNGEQDIYYSYIPYDPLTSINENLSQAQKTQNSVVYPNPISDEFMVVFSSRITQDVKINIMNPEGKIFTNSMLYKLQVGENELSLNKSTFSITSSGIYFIEVVNRRSERLCTKLVIIN